MAVQASMTGHLVLATLNANDAVSAIARLRDLGLDQASIATTLRGAIGQRLVRRVCRDCAIDPPLFLSRIKATLRRARDVELPGPARNVLPVNAP